MASSGVAASNRRSVSTSPTRIAATADSCVGLSTKASRIHRSAGTPLGLPFDDGYDPHGGRADKPGGVGLLDGLDLVECHSGGDVVLLEQVVQMRQELFVVWAAMDIEHFDGRRSVQNADLRDQAVAQRHSDRHLGRVVIGIGCRNLDPGGEDVPAVGVGGFHTVQSKGNPAREQAGVMVTHLIAIGAFVARATLLSSPPHILCQ